VLLAAEPDRGGGQQQRPATGDQRTGYPVRARAAPVAQCHRGAHHQAGADGAGQAATYAFPVIGHNSYAHTHHDYPATDIITNCGNRVVAVTTGTILVVTRVDRWTPSQNLGATRGGLSVSLLGDDGVRYYGVSPCPRTTRHQSGRPRHHRQTLGQGRPQQATPGPASCTSASRRPAQRSGDWWNPARPVYPWPYLDA
jgi:hypothetical protein